MANLTLRTLTNPFDADTEVTPANSIPAVAVPYVYELNVALATKNNYYLIPPNAKYPAGYEYHAYLTNTGMKFYRVSANSANIATGNTFYVTGRITDAYFGRTNRATYTYYSV